MLTHPDINVTFESQTRLTDGRVYQVAARSLQTDLAIPALEGYEIASANHVPKTLPPKSISDGSKLVYRGPGWIGNRWRNVTCRWSANGYWINVDQGGDLWIALDGTAIAHLGTSPTDQPEIVVESMLGPALITALALQGTWCLHASAVLYREHLIAFLGDSGAGKSTLAAFLGAEGGSDWQHVADDILPATLVPRCLDGLPHFPQLKLPPDRQPSIGLPRRLPIGIVYLLSQPHSTGHDEISVTPLDLSAATLALVRHSVASRLFGKPLLARHLVFCAEAAARVLVRHLSYPHRLDLLPAVSCAIADDANELWAA